LRFDPLRRGFAAAAGLVLMSAPCAQQSVRVRAFRSGQLDSSPISTFNEIQ
jgi:hypothetical protein